MAPSFSVHAAAPFECAEPDMSAHAIFLFIQSYIIHFYFLWILII